jgi:hypothetical protein
MLRRTPTHTILLDRFVDTCTDEAKYHHGPQKALLCVEIFQKLLNVLDPEVFSPLRIYLEHIKSHVHDVIMASPNDDTRNTTSVAISSAISPVSDKKPPETGHALMVPPMERPMPPPHARSKRFIQLPKHEQHVLQVVLYLKEILLQTRRRVTDPPTKGRLETTKGSIPMTKMNQQHHYHHHQDTKPPLLRMMRRVRTQLKNDLFFSQLSSCVSCAGTPRTGETTCHHTHHRPNVRRARAVQHKAWTYDHDFSCICICLHEIIRAVACHSMEISTMALHLVGEALDAMHNYLAEASTKRRHLRFQVKVLRLERAHLTIEWAKIDAKSAQIEQASVTLAKVLHEMEAEYTMLERECHWHVTCKELMSARVRYHSM